MSFACPASPWFDDIASRVSSRQLFGGSPSTIAHPGRGSFLAPCDAGNSCPSGWVGSEAVSY